MSGSERRPSGCGAVLTIVVGLLAVAGTIVMAPVYDYWIARKAVQSACPPCDCEGEQ